MSGPPWAEFAKQMGSMAMRPRPPGQSISYLFIGPCPVIVMSFGKNAERATEPRRRSSIGQRLDCSISRVRHGISLSVIRYDSWQKFATNETNSIAQTNKKEGGWFQLREHVSFHTDTLTDRIRSLIREVRIA